MISNFKEDKFLKQIKEKREIAMSLVVFVVFLVATAVILKDVNPTKENVPNYFELSRNPYLEYEELLDKTNMKKLISSRQFFEMRYNEDVVKEEETSMREDPFIEGFIIKYENEDEGESEGENEEENNNEEDENNENNEGDRENEN